MCFSLVVHEAELSQSGKRGGGGEVKEAEGTVVIFSLPS